MKIIEKTCGLVCPVIAEKDHEIACLKLDLKHANARINILLASKHEDEKRIAKARQALFGVVDINIVDKPKIVGGP